MIPPYTAINFFPHEAAIRIGFFLLIFAAVALAEAGAPRRPLTTWKTARWRVNLAMTLVDAVVARFLFPILPVGLALLAASRGWGVLNHLSVSFWLAVFLGVLFLDLVIYLQHVMFHTLPLFWRLHGMHHTDLDIDVTSGLRFHPLEICLSTLIKLAAVAALGVPALAVLVFEVLLNGTSMFNHGNIRIGKELDRLLRVFIVTPDMHRVHHSVIIRETNSNFGFNFPWWDRIFGTYRPQPARGHDAMTIGLARFRDAGTLTLPFLLLLPFRRGGMAGRGVGGGQTPERKADQASGGGSTAAMTGEKRCIVIFVRYPEKGAVKSRLAPVLEEKLIVLLYESFVSDLLATLEKSGYPFRIAFTPADRKADIFRRFGRHDGFPQTGADLGERMKNAFQRCFADGFVSVVLIGSDIPDLPPEIFKEAFAALESRGAVIGPAADGGYYLIGFREETFVPGVFEGIAWGTEGVFAATLERLARACVGVHPLPLRRDVDTPEDLQDLVRRHRDTPFARSRTMACLAAAHPPGLF